MSAFTVLGLLTEVEGGHWTVITHYAGPHFTALTLLLRQLLNGWLLDGKLHAVTPCVGEKIKP